MEQIENFIDGGFVASGGPRMVSLDPSTGETLVSMPNSTTADVDAAVAAAKRAFRPWARTPRSERSQWLLRIADALEARLDEFAALESQDQGKPFWLAKAVDIPRAVYNFRFFAGAILYATDTSTVLDQVPAINFSTRSPIGVAALITPWNLPLYLLTWKIAPALATGNTAVCKPSELTSLTAFRLAKLMQEVGLPPGVCNMVFGTGQIAGAALVEHPDVSLVSFTGGTVTGERIRVLTAPRGKKLSLELGGKNPALVFDDVDLDQVVVDLARACFTNQGEICLCASRLYVQETIIEKFVAKFVDAARAIKVGPPKNADSKMGALVSEDHLHKVLSYVALAKEEGGTIECGHGVDAPPELPTENAKGFFMRPTVITGLNNACRCVREEIFGPVVCVVPFIDEADAVAQANDNEYGLSATVWSKDGARCTRVAQELQVGTVWINCWMVRDLNMPFGGMKASGSGRESAEDSLRYFTEAKTICTKY